MYTQDEKTMAMLAHGSILLNVFSGFGGIIVALIIWLVKKNESPWVGFQALQSFIYQVIAGSALVVIWAISLALMMIIVGFLCLPFALLLTLATLIYALYGAYRCYQGYDFRYLWLGDFLAAQQAKP